MGMFSGGSGLRMLIVENSSFKFKTLDPEGWVNGMVYTKDGNIIYSNANELIVMKDFKKIGAHNQENGFIFDVPTTVYIDHRAGFGQLMKVRCGLLQWKYLESLTLMMVYIVTR